MAVDRWYPYTVGRDRGGNTPCGSRGCKWV